MANDKQEEMLQRLINIELKVNALSHETPGFTGHADQAYGHLTYAQFGEDLIIANIFTMLGIQAPSYIDVGAHHPLNVSNTALLHARGSKGINVEANPDLIPAFQKYRPGDITLNVGVGRQAGRLKFYRIDAYSGRNTFSKEVAEAFTREHPQFRVNDVLDIDILPLNDIIQRHAGGVFPDFLTIDVEGLDYDVLDAADFSRSRPKVICVEAVSGADSDDSSRLLNLLKSKGYEAYTRTLGNLIMVDGESFEKLRRLLR